jgi:hypothetical protein
MNLLAKADDHEWERPQFKWQPIATAPKDGTRILAVWANGKEHTIIEWAKFNGEGGWCQHASGLGSDWPYSSDGFSHWMPLPAPPKVA